MINTPDLNRHAKIIHMRHRLLNRILRIHRRLLPDDPHIGWSPYLWLLYLGFLLPGLWNQPVLSAPWGLTVLSVPVFLVLYFRGFWLRGRPQLFNILAIATIGAALLPFNAGASVYFIYAGAPAAFITTPFIALVVLSALTAFFAIESILLELPLVAWLIPAFILMLVGVSNIFYSEMARKNARLRLTQEEVSHLAALAERERIARDLHDLLGQSLSLITIKAELAGRLFERDAARAQREVAELERVSREALREVRKAVSGYRHIGWEGELEKARMALKAANLNLETEIEPCTMSLSQETVLAMVLREAITNIIRHAYARSCTIQLSVIGDHLRLCISDDGRGGRFTPGNGLSGMRERVEQLNGQLQIDSRNGTQLVIELPYPDKISPLHPWNNAA